MPYRNAADLPEAARKHLLKHAQQIYLKAYNSAWEQIRDPKRRRDKTSREATAQRVAWAAVERACCNDADGTWRKRKG